MANSRCVVILGLPRSGSSALAGALHKMGVDMGKGHLQPPDLLNSRGYYEDTRWNTIHKVIVGLRYSTKEPDTLPDRYRRSYGRLASMCSYKPIWGMKSPRLCFVLHLILPILRDSCEVRVVHVRRDWEANVASLKRHSEVAYRGRFKMSDDEAEAKLSEWQAALERRLEEFGGPVYEVNYSDLVDEPVTTLMGLEAFCFEGMEEFSSGIEGAADWTDPSLRHEREEAELEAEVDATDAAVELAPKAGLDITTITGTGQDGRVLARDVKAYLESYGDTDTDAESGTGGSEPAVGDADGGNAEGRG